MTLEIELPTGTATRDAVRALFPTSVLNTSQQPALKTDRAIARLLLGLAFLRDRHPNAWGRACELVPDGLMKMDHPGRLSEGECAALCAAMWIAAGGALTWSQPRIAAAFGAPWALVAADIVVMTMVLHDGAPASLLNGITDLHEDMRRVCGDSKRD